MWPVSEILARSLAINGRFVEYIAGNNGSKAPARSLAVMEETSEAP
jgi:hypothetical protein